MNKYVIKFSHVEESEYTAIVEAESYEEAMDIFDENPFEFLESESPIHERSVDWNVSEVTQGDNIVYKSSRELIAKYC